MSHLREWLITAPTGTARYWFCLSVLVSRLSPVGYERFRTLLLSLMAPLAERTPILRGSRHTIVLSDAEHGRLPWVVADSSDFAVLNELLVLEEYDPTGLGDDAAPCSILDLGAHAGASVLWFSRRYPRAEIWAVEPDPRTAERLRQNVGHIGRVGIVEAAVTDRSGVIDFFPAARGWASALVPASRVASPVQVRALTLDMLLEELELDQVDLLKLDIEGAEFDVLRSTRRLEDIGAVVGELHGPISRQREVVSFLHRFFEVQVVHAPGHCTFRARHRGGRP
jgi:FkbM family methyltransferase